MSLRARSTSSKKATTSSHDTSDNVVSDRPPPRTSFSQRALESSANLANLLPTGTLLAFQVLIPTFTNSGSCDSATTSMTTFILLVLLATSCFIACFTDSFTTPDGQVFYGLATLKGLWIFDYQAAVASGIPRELEKFRVGFIDLVHAVLSVLVFVAIALKDKNVVSCFYPKPDHQTQRLLDIVPIAIGLICSMLFVVSPTRRHGIGFPVTPNRR